MMFSRVGERGVSMCSMSAVSVIPRCTKLTMGACSACFFVLFTICRRMHAKAVSEPGDIKDEKKTKKKHLRSCGNLLHTYLIVVYLLLSGRAAAAVARRASWGVVVTLDKNLRVDDAIDAVTKKKKKKKEKAAREGLVAVVYYRSSAWNSICAGCDRCKTQ